MHVPNIPKPLLAVLLWKPQGGERLQLEIARDRQVARLAFHQAKRPFEFKSVLGLRELLDKGVHRVSLFSLTKSIKN